MGTGGTNRKIDIARMLPFTEPAVVEGVKHELAREPQNVERPGTVFGNKRPGRRIVLAKHDFGFLCSDIIGSLMPLSKPFETRYQVFVFIKLDR